MTDVVTPGPNNPGGVETVNGGSPAISGNGQFIAFEHGGNNNGQLDIQVANYFGSPAVPVPGVPNSFVVTDIASADPSFDPNNTNQSFGNTGSLYNPGLSGDGRYVAFWSTASEFTVNGVAVPVDNTSDGTGGFAQVYVYDRFLNKLVMVSVNDDGTPGDGNSAALSLSQNGSTDGDHDSWAPAMSADGRFVVFQSNAQNLLDDNAGGADPDSNGKSDVYLYDLQNQTIQRVSVAADGSELDGNSYRPAISPDGHYVTFASDGADGSVQSYVREIDPTTGLLSTGFDGSGNGFNGLGETVSAGGTVAAFGGVAFGFNASPDDGHLTDNHDGTITFTAGPVSDYNASAVVTLTLHVDHGTLAPAAALNGLSIVGGNDGSNGTLELSGSIDAINKALASGAVYTPADGATSDTFTGTLSDSQHGTATRSGTFDIATAQFSGGATNSGQQLDIFLSDGSATSGAVIEDQNVNPNGNVVTASGVLKFSDADATDTHTVSTVLTSATFSNGDVPDANELAALLADFSATVTEPSGVNAGVMWRGTSRSPTASCRTCRSAERRRWCIR